MKTFFRSANRERLVQRQAQRIAELEAHNRALSDQLDKLRGSMRRCVSCDYRLEVLAGRTRSKLDDLRRTPAPPAELSEPDDGDEGPR